MKGEISTQAFGLVKCQASGNRPNNAALRRAIVPGLTSAKFAIEKKVTAAS